MLGAAERANQAPHDVMHTEITSYHTQFQPGSRPRPSHPERAQVMYHTCLDHCTRILETTSSMVCLCKFTHTGTITAEQLILDQVINAVASKAQANEGLGERDT